MPNMISFEFKFYSRKSPGPEMREYHGKRKIVMKKNSLQFVLITVFILGLFSCNRQGQKESDTTKKIENLISELSLKEKVKMLSGTGFDTPAIERLGIPGLRMTDGPAGARWGKSTAFPSPMSLAASWDSDLIFRVGQAIAEEVKLKNKNVLLAPCVNIHRFPLGGRNFESYGEDPFLAAHTGVAFIKGVQSRNVIATVKHYAANNQEWERFKVNTIVSERTLREIYLPAFKAAVQEAGVYSVMAAYNKVNGHYCSANKILLTDILKDEWGFDGYVVSDWGATHNTVAAANAGLDIEMPYGKHFGDSLIMAVNGGKLSETVIDEKVRRILRIMFRAGLMDATEIQIPEASSIYDSNKSLALEVAEKGIVLLKNDQSMLPLQKDDLKSIAIIGPNAANAISGGGGSSMVRPFYRVSPLDGIKNYLGNDVQLYYASGPAMDGDILPVESTYLFQKDKKSHGLTGEYFKFEDFEAEPVFSRIDRQLHFNFGYNAPESEMEALDDGNKYSIRWTGLLKAPATGTYDLKLQCDGGVRLFVDGQLLFEDMDNKSVKLRTGKIHLTKNHFYDIKIEYVSSWGVSEVKFGWDIPGVNRIKEAVDVARKADVVILVTGLSNHFESESGDLKRFTFPEQDKFIKAIAAANPNTVVVMYNGSPYSIKEWVQRVPAMLEAWYGGQEQGNALAHVLFGEYNPSAKLPFSMISDSVDCPAFAGYQSSTLGSNYSEGVFVGYRYLDKNGIHPIFPFGHGLSYTSFQYSNLRAEVMSDGNVQVSLTIKNTGKRDGTETVQFYVSDPESSVLRPVQELKAFQHLRLKAGEETQLSLRLNSTAFAFYSETQKSWVVEPGKFIIKAGSSLRDIRLEQLVEIGK
jgi:beta-glucosidase